MRKPHYELVSSGDSPYHNALDQLAQATLLDRHKTLALLPPAVIQAYIVEAAMCAINQKPVDYLKWAYRPDAISRERNPYPEQRHEWMAFQTMAIYLSFRLLQPAVYKIATGFGEQLAKVDLNIRAGLLPKDGMFCIEFPDSIRFEDQPEQIEGFERQIDKDFFHCAYVTTQYSNKDLPLKNNDNQPIFLSLNIMLPCYDDKERFKGEENSLSLTFLSPTEPISEVIRRAKHNSSHPIQNEGVISYVLKCMVYINSGDPDLRNYRAPNPPATNNPKKQRRWAKEHQNQSLIDMVLVGYNFKKPVTYSVDETTVTGHFRWQPCGPRLEQVKLIWIAEHIRHFNQSESP